MPATGQDGSSGAGTDHSAVTNSPTGIGSLPSWGALSPLSNWVDSVASSRAQDSAAPAASGRSAGSLARAFSRISLSASGTPSRSGLPDMTR